MIKGRKQEHPLICGALTLMFPAADARTPSQSSAGGPPARWRSTIPICEGYIQKQIRYT